MIVSTRKPVEEILDMLKGVKKVAICGCHECALACKVGGDDEVAEMKQLLESKGFQVVATAMPTESCLNFHVRKAAKELMKGNPEAVLSLACGSGIQTLAGQLKVPVYPGSNTQFIVLLPRANYENSCMVCARIIRAFFRKHPHSPADISYIVQALEPSAEPAFRGTIEGA